MFMKFNTTDDISRIDIQEAHLTIVNDSTTNSVLISEDSVNFIELKPEESLTILDYNKNSIYVKNLTAGNSAPLRIISFGNKNIIYNNINNVVTIESAKIPIDIDTNFESKSIKQKIGVN